MSTNKSTWKKLTSMRLFMPLVCLLAIIIVATITIPGFLSMSLKNGVPYGYPVDVINRASELVILSVGMTLVTAASGGQDISVGAVMAVAGAVCCQILSGGEVSVNSLSAPMNDILRIEPVSSPAAALCISSVPPPSLRRKDKNSSNSLPVRRLPGHNRILLSRCQNPDLLPSDLSLPAAERLFYQSKLCPEWLY